MGESVKKSIVWIIVYVLIGSVSFLFLSEPLSKAENYPRTMETINKIENEAIGMTGLATAAATVAAAIPTETATPIANKLMDIAGYMVIIYTAIILEKYMLTMLGGVIFKYLIPVACLILIIFRIIMVRMVLKRYKGGAAGFIYNARDIVLKIVCFTLIIWAMVPASAVISDNLYDVYGASKSEQINQLDAQYDNKVKTESKEVNTEDEHIWTKMKNKFKGTVNNVIGTGEKAIDYCKAYMNILLEWVAVLIITACVIPIAVLFVGLWLAKIMFGLNIGTNPAKYAGMLKASHLKMGKKKDKNNDMLLDTSYKAEE